MNTISPGYTPQPNPRASDLIAAIKKEIKEHNGDFVEKSAKAPRGPDEEFFQGFKFFKKGPSYSEMYNQCFKAKQERQNAVIADLASLDNREQDENRETGKVAITPKDDPMGRMELEFDPESRALNRYCIVGSGDRKWSYFENNPHMTVIREDDKGKGEITILEKNDDYDSTLYNISYSLKDNARITSGCLSSGYSQVLGILDMKKKEALLAIEKSLTPGENKETIDDCDKWIIIGGVKIDKKK